EGLRHVVGLDGTAGDVDDGDAGLRPPAPAEVVGHAHRPGGVAGHGVDAAVGGAGAGGDDRVGLRGQVVDPGGQGDGLAGPPVGADGGPVPLVLDVLVGDRPLDDQDERGAEPVRGGGVPGAHVLVAALGRVEHAVVQVDLRQAG